MSISPKCDIKDCGKELQDFGAILLSPPYGEKNQEVKKYHICKECFRKIEAGLI